MHPDLVAETRAEVERIRNALENEPAAEGGPAGMPHA
jgi:hypothetical protein